MNTMLVMNNPQFIQVLTDRFIVFLALFVMLMVGAFTRNTTMDKTSSFREMIVVSVFLGLLMTFEADVIMKRTGYSMFFVALLLGLVEKEALQVIKKYIIAKITKISSSGPKDKDPPENKQ